MFLIYVNKSYIIYYYSEIDHNLYTHHHSSVLFFRCHSYIFGGITVGTGIVGVLIGSFISRKLKDKVANADPLICAVGMLSSSPCLFIAMTLASMSIPATYVCNFTLH